MIIEKSNSEYTPDCLFSRGNTSSVRALATIAILFCHLGETMLPGRLNPFSAFFGIGYLPVAVFFFFSGYNIFFSRICCPDTWHKGFWKKKIFRIYLPFVIANFLYQCYYLLLNASPHNIRVILHYLLGIDLLNGTLWYIQSILLLYFLCYCFFRLASLFADTANQKTVLSIISIAVMIVYYFIYSRYGAYVDGYSAIPVPFLLGALIVIWKEQIFPFWVKYRDSVFLISLFILCWTLAARFNYGLVLEINGFDIYVCLATIVTPVLSMTLLMGLELRSRFLDFISKYSLELYLLHALCYRFFRYVVNIENDLLYLLAYLSTTFVLAIIVHKFCFLLYRLFSKSVNQF